MEGTPCLCGQDKGGGDQGPGRAGGGIPEQTLLGWGHPGSPGTAGLWDKSLRPREKGNCWERKEARSAPQRDGEAEAAGGGGGAGKGLLLRGRGLPAAGGPSRAPWWVVSALKGEPRPGLARPML